MEQFDLFGNNIETKEPMGRYEIEKSVVDLLYNISLTDLVNLLTNKFDAMIEYYNLSHGAKSSKRTSLLFNPHRLCVRANNRPSIYEGTKSLDFLSGLARAIAFRYNDSGGRANDLLYLAFQLGGINSWKYVNEFPPHAARDLCKKFGVTKNDKVLDPCSGWDGRMLGVSVVCDNYFGFEPSTLTHSGLCELSKFIRTMNDGFNADVRCLPFEDSVLPSDTFDFALTSPPYYDTEDYCDEETNSLNRYRSFDEWCDGFYIPMIQKTMDSLKDGCAFVLNIGSRVYPLNEVLFDNFNNKYNIKKTDNYISGNGGGLRNASKEGETFYVIRKI